MEALLRLFGLTSEQRRVRRQDFHVPSNEAATPTQRELAIEAILAFPELDSEGADHTAVPEFSIRWPLMITAGSNVVCE